VNYNRMRTHDAGLRAGTERADAFGGPGRRNIYQRPRNVTRNITPENRRLAGTVMPDRANDLFAGRDGNVFRRDDSGWQTRSDNEWARDRDTPGASREYDPQDFAGRPYRPSEAGMDRDFYARDRGDYRANTVQHFDEFRGAPAGGYVHGGGGGGFHGGGGGGFHGGGGGGRR
jgi:hypothetical protein